MSVNQSKGNNNEPQQYRRSGRSGNPASQKNFSGGGGKGGGGSTTAPPSSSFNSGKSFKKVVSNAQGTPNRVTVQNQSVNLSSPNSSTVGRAVQNGAHIQPPLSGTPDASSTGPTLKPTDASVQKSTPGLPKAPQSNAVPSGSSSSGAMGPTTPVKGSADASKAFSLQFGSISPGVMNGMQVPARTNSAPPNLDEQKRVQARLESFKATSFQNPPVPKPRKDAANVDQSNPSESHSTPKEKGDVLSSTTPIKPSGPPMPSIPGVSMQIPFHQNQNYLQFGGPNPPLQSQPMVNNTSMPVPLPMHLPVGNPPFVPGIQHHPMSSQGIIHQNQGLNFTSQMGHQIGNMGMGLGPQYQQQQMGNFGGTRRTVKITHPDTHEELRLDKRTDGYPNGAPSGPRGHPHGPPSFPTPHSMNYYPNSYNAGPIFYPPPGSNSPLTSAQITPGSQAPRFYNQQPSKQVTVKPAVTAHGEKAGDSPAMDKSEIPKIQKPVGEGQGQGQSTLPRKDSEVAVTGISLPEPAATSSKPHASSVVIEDAMPPGKKGHSVLSSSDGHQGDSSVQETVSLETNKDVLEVSNTVDIDEKGLVSTEGIGSGTSSDKPPIVEGPVGEIVGSKEEIKDSVDQNQHSTVETVTIEEQQKESVDNDNVKSSSISTSDVNVISTGTSLLNLGSSHTEESPYLDAGPRAVSVPETPPLTSEVESKGNKSNNNTTPKGKKKIKEILKNADARGSTSDLYNAYKRPEEKKETSSSSSEIVESSSDIITTKQESVELSKKDVKFEPEDWEDAADISAPKLETSNLKHNSEVDNEGMTKKYSRDFLLKFSEQCTDLPEGFEVTTDIAEVLMGSSGSPGPGHGHGPHPSPVRGGAGPRLDRRLSNVGGEDDKWSKGSGPMGPGRDMRVDPGYNAAGFRGNHGGVLRTPRPQPPGQYTGGILSGPIQSPGPQGSYRNNSDSDRWQRASGYQKGLIPSPTPMPVMHKAERKYEVGKITDEEQAKQRQLKGILNKLTPQNFEKLFEQVKQVNIDNAGTLSGVIDQIFDKALMEPTFVEMYANFCSRLSVELPDFSEDNEKITFKRLLLNKCQEEFERGERDEAEADRTEEEDEVKQTEEQREEKRVQARRRMLGNIRLIGELYKKKMLTEKIMHECIKKLFGKDHDNPDEENIESLCKLMSTIGEMIDHAKAKEHMDIYFDTMFKLSNNMKLSSRVRFMLKDVIDLRKNRWQQRRKVEGPKKIEEVHRDAAQERQAQSNRLARGPNPNPSLRRGQGQPMDFGPKGSNLLPNPQTGYRGLPQQNRGYGNQDSRFEERHSFENRTLSVPLRPVGDDNITLGPQGGLARGMSVRGQPPPMRVVGGPNGYGSVPERSGYGPRDDFGPRYSPRPAYEPEQHRVPPSSPPPRGRVPTPPESGKVLSEDRLHDMSIEAIKEFYSARDEKEVALCVKDLNAPGFYPSMISIWVTDSFERKDMDRESLAKLLINLTKSQEVLSQDSLARGFESVLSTLEDAVNDAPRAAEFLGRILARVILENVIPYKQVWRLIYEGGEEQGRLVEIGLAAEVVGVILEIVKSEKGDSFLNDLRAGSDPRLDKFRSTNVKKASRLDKFI